MTTETTPGCADPIDIRYAPPREYQQRNQQRKYRQIPDDIARTVEEAAKENKADSIDTLLYNNVVAPTGAVVSLYLLMYSIAEKDPSLTTIGIAGMIGTLIPIIYNNLRSR